MDEYEEESGSEYDCVPRPGSGLESGCSDEFPHDVFLNRQMFRKHSIHKPLYTKVMRAGLGLGSAFVVVVVCVGARASARGRTFWWVLCVI